MAIQKISNAVIADNAIDSDNLASGAVTAADITDGTITAAKLDTSDSYTVGALTSSGNVWIGDSSDGLLLNKTTGAAQIIGVDTGFNGWNDIDIRTGTSTQLYLDTSGNVGVGTTSPSSRLEVEDDDEVTLTLSANLWDNNGVSGNTKSSRIRFCDTDNTGAYGAGIRAWVNDGSFYDHNGIALFTSDYPSNEVDRLVVDYTGNVGIGTTNPTQKLSVAGSIESLDDGNGEGGELVLRAQSGYNYRYSIDNRQDELRIFSSNDSDESNGVVRLYINSSGYVGIGTGATARLQVGTNTNSTDWSDRIIFGGYSGSTLDSAITSTANSRARVWIAGGGEGQAGLGLYNGDSGGTGGTIYMVSGYLGVKDKAGNNPMRIDMGGSAAHMVRILGDTAVEGTTGDSRGLSIYTAGGTSCPIYFGSESHSAQKSIYLSGYWMTYRGHQNEGHRFVFSQPAGTAIRGDEYRFRYNSATRPGGSTTWDGFSDIRAKENIRDMTGALDTISRLRPVRYDWTDDYADSQNMWNMNKDSDKPYEWYSVKENGYDTLKKNDQYGFIAQEFEEVFPHDVAESELTLGDEDIKDFKTVNFDSLIPVLTKAIQELKAENDALKARVEALEG